MFYQRSKCFSHVDFYCFEMADNKNGNRKSYTREYKLNAVKCLDDNDKNVSRASTHFKRLTEKVSENGLNPRKLFRNKSITHENKSDRKAIYPKVESELYKLFSDVRKSRRKCKRWRFLSRQAKR